MRHVRRVGEQLVGLTQHQANTLQRARDCAPDGLAIDLYAAGPAGELRRKGLAEIVERLDPDKPRKKRRYLVATEQGLAWLKAPEVLPGQPVAPQSEPPADDRQMELFK